MIYKYIAIICILMFISSCTSTNPSYIDIKKIRTGTDGISMVFLPQGDIPMMEEESRTVSVQLKNDGAFDVGHMYFLLGTESDYVTLGKTYFNGGEGKQEDKQGQLTTYLPENLFKGKSLKTVVGDYAEYDAELTTKKITLSKYQDTLLSAILCYEYGTVAEDEVCIQPSVSVIGLQAACVPKDLTFSSQGAPLVVNKVEVKSTLTTNKQIKTLFKIYFENKGIGDVLNWNTGRLVCSSKPMGEEKIWNYFIMAAFLGDKEIECRVPKTTVLGDSYWLVRLKGGKAEVVCESTSPSGVAYTTPFTVKAFYDYTQTLTKKLTIERTS
ncbi:MAG: hypothetical protein WC471_00820 [Candidatus Woesearchaeota archaeon]